MPTAEEIKALVNRMPELDTPPPAPPEPVEPAPEVKPPAPKPTDPNAKPLEAPKPKPKPKPPAGPKGTLTGPAWPDAEKLYDAILAGGKESVGHVIDLVTENDVGPAYKPRYVLHGMAVYACRPGKETERAAIIAAIVPELTGSKPKGIRALLVRTLQTCGDAKAAQALAPLLADEELADVAAQAMTSLGGDTSKHFRDALAGAKGRAKLAIVQALGATRDAGAIAALADDMATDPNENLRVTAVWSLARSGDAAAIEPVLKATDVKEGWPRAQATRAAFALAESLAKAGKKADAGRIYRHLVGTRDPDHEKHQIDAAQRGLDAAK
jgi:hypothetical protein